uniref:DUF1868 domain-containing protein n=1 Tax=Hanusia phi TaxID=3032 RepID=A0A6T7LYX6_9CRYP|mmetsp:Transcript_10214/g.23315  ORF Transcript_10214/g.23315 Transcript_10214/m.23315 type:complete len:237 (+) Transcript_10214:37-747(+)
MCDDEIVANKYIKDLERGTSEECWGLVLITNFPCDPSMQTVYETVAAEIRNNPEFKDAYVYPFSTLHTTILTCYAFTRPRLDSEKLQQEYLNGWNELIDQARLHPEWPKGKIRLHCKEAVAYPDAVVLMYDDVDKKIETMRKILKAEAESKFVQLGYENVDASMAHFPTIIHSTIIRWRDAPNYKYSQVKQSFESIMQKHWPADGLMLSADKMHLVVETVPYMHPPQNLHCTWELL